MNDLDIFIYIYFDVLRNARLENHTINKVGKVFPHSELYKYIIAVSEYLIKQSTTFLQKWPSSLKGNNSRCTL